MVSTLRGNNGKHPSTHPRRHHLLRQVRFAGDYQYLCRNPVAGSPSPKSLCSVSSLSSWEESKSSEAPKEEDKTPKKEDKTPNKEDKTPKKEDKTPKKEDKTPKKEYKTTCF
jgi:hypothetical protein